MAQWFLRVAVAISVAANAVLFQQLTTGQAVAEEAQQKLQTSLTRQAQMKNTERQLRTKLESSKKEHLAAMYNTQKQLNETTQQLTATGGGGLMDFSSIPIRTIQQMGHLFFAHKISETFMDDDVMELLGYNEEMLGRKQYLTKYGYELVSVRINPSERKAWQLQEDTADVMADRLDEAGMVLIPSLHDRDLCRRIAHQVHKDIMSPTGEFGNIAANEFRKDLPLLLAGDYLEILRDALLLLQPVFEKTLGRGARLKEFSTLSAYPGAEDQPFHPDSRPIEEEDLVNDAKLFSAFIYLDDVGEFVAPFDAVPGTHTHTHFVDDEDVTAIMRNNPWVRLAVPQGSLVIYDSRLRHRGSGNTSPLTRPTFYFSLSEANKPDPLGPAYSLHQSYKRHTITVEDIITRDVPKVNLEETTMANHDDDLCEDSMMKACGEVSGDPVEFYHCAVNPRHEHRTPRLTDEDDSSDDSSSDDSSSDDSSSDESDDADDETDPDTIAYNLLPLKNCTLRSRMERIAKLYIYQPGYKSKVSWGDL